MKVPEEREGDGGAPDAEISSLRDKAASATAWVALERIIEQALQLAIFVVLARLLGPDPFGLLAMVMVWTGFVGMFSDLGLAAAVVQRGDLDEDHRSSIHWFGVAIGLGLVCLVAASAGPVGAFYGKPALAPVVQLMSVTFLLAAANLVQTALLTRSMNFRALAGVNVSSKVVGGAVAVVLAYEGFGVWSLAWQGVTTVSAALVVTWFVSPWRPRCIFIWPKVKDLLGFGVNLTVFGFINYWVRNSDNLLIGKTMGAADLGLYSRAYGLLLMPLNLVSGTVGRVMFPLMSSIKGDVLRIKGVYLRTVSAVALLTFPMMAGLFVVAESAVVVLLGDKWSGIVPLVRVFCLLGMAQSIATTAGWIYLSQGRADLQLRWGLFSGPLLIGSIVAGILIGSPMAVAVCYGIMSGIVLFYPNMMIPGRLIGMTFEELVRALLPILSCAFAMSVVVWWIRWLGTPALADVGHLLVEIPTGAAVYLLLIHRYRIDAYQDLRQMLCGRLPRRWRQECV